MTAMLTEKCKLVGCRAPVDATTTVTGKVVNTKNYNRVTFVIQAGELAATTTLTVVKGTTSSASTAIGFNYRKSTTGASGYTELDGALTAVADTGVAFTNGSDEYKMIVVEVEVLPDCGATYDWVGVVLTGCTTGSYFSILAILSDARYMQALPLTAL